MTRIREGRVWLADRRESRRRKAGIVLGLCSFLLVHGAFASHVEVDLQTIGQGYQTRTITGELLDRGRVTQWASVHAGELWGKSGVSLQLQMRFDTDFALWLDGKASDTSSLDLLNFVLRMDGLVPLLDVTLGRQVIVDEIDFLEFDGLELIGHLPWGIRFGLLGGFAVRDRTWLGGGMLELDGVEQGDIPAPVVGASLGLRRAWLNLGVDYRRVMLWDDGWPLQSERLGLWGRGIFWHRKIGIEGGATYDLAQDDFQRIHAQAWTRLDWPLRGLRLDAGFLRSRPEYSLDSIFNFFSPAPFWQLQLGLRMDSAVPEVLRASMRLEYYHRAYASADTWEGQDVGLVGTQGQVDGVQLDARLGLGHRSSAWIYAGFEDGAAGRRWMFSPGFMWNLLEDVLSLDARAILLQVADGYESRYDVLNVGAWAGARWSFGAGRAVIVSTELNSNRINPLSFRMLVVLDLSFSYGPGGYR